jgi:hypothetical protein
MSNKLVTVATFLHSVRANMAKNFLESMGVPGFLADVEFVTCYWTYANAMGWIKFQIGDQDADEARTLLSRLSELEAPPPVGLEDVF